MNIHRSDANGLCPGRSETSNDYPHVLKWNYGEKDRGTRIIVCKHGIQWIIQYQAKGGQWLNRSFCRTRAALENLLPGKAEEIKAALPERCS